MRKLHNDIARLRGTELLPEAVNVACENVEKSSENDNNEVVALDAALLEFCAKPISKLGERAPEGTRVVRLTLDDDMASEEGVQKAEREIDNAGGVFLYGSLPCTWAANGKL